MMEQLQALIDDMQRVFTKLIKLQEADPPAFLFENSLRAVNTAQIAVLIFCAVLLAAGVWYVFHTRYRRACICAGTGIAAGLIYAFALMPLAQLITEKGGL